MYVSILGYTKSSPFKETSSRGTDTSSKHKAQNISRKIDQLYRIFDFKVMLEAVAIYEELCTSLSLYIIPQYSKVYPKHLILVYT
jgi:hypothetical protein